MSKKYPNRNVAAAIARIIRRTIGTKSIHISDIDWSNQDNLSDVNDCLDYLVEIDSVLREKVSLAELLKLLKVQISELVEQFIEDGITLVTTREEQKITDAVKNWRDTISVMHPETWTRM